MRHLLTFDCEGSTLAASLDAGTGRTGLLIVTGGTQTRIGSHRLFERLAAALAENGISCFRFDRRGVGDSDGQDPGWRDSRSDIAAAIAAFRREAKLDRLFGFGLCDGASALVLHAGALPLDGLILANPWFVETEAGEPPAAAVKLHYRKQLASLEGWKRLLTGSVSYSKILKGLRRIISPPPSSLADQLANALRSAGKPVELVLARGDATAIAADAEWCSGRFTGLGDRLYVETDSHTFARPGDLAALLEACRSAVDRLASHP